MRWGGVDLLGRIMRAVFAEAERRSDVACEGQQCILIDTSVIKGTVSQLEEIVE